MLTDRVDQCSVDSEKGGVQDLERLDVVGVVGGLEVVFDYCDFKSFDC